MERILVAAVGDISTGTEPLDAALADVVTTLRSADIRFAQAEMPYTTRGRWVEQCGPISPFKRTPDMAAGFKSVPFDVLSTASNHAGDWGPEGIEDTVRTFQDLKIPTVGSGRNIEEARRPVVIECKGLRIAFLGYVSVIPVQTWATADRAGCAPMRAHTYYEPYEYQPGAPPRVVTVPHAADLEHLVDDVRHAKQRADLVFVSMHWGVHFQPRPCDYQRVVAHAAIDAGATAILGHHAHQPQGVERYKDGIIFYSIGNFCFGSTRKGSTYCLPHAEYTHQEVYSIEPDPGFVFDYHRHWKEGGVAFFDVDRTGIHTVTYAPVLLNEKGQPKRVQPEDPQFDKALEYLNWAGKFIPGGVTSMTAAGDRFEVFARGS